MFLYFNLKKNIRRTCIKHTNIKLNRCPRCHCLLPPLSVPLTVADISDLLYKMESNGSKKRQNNRNLLKKNALHYYVDVLTPTKT